MNELIVLDHKGDTTITWNDADDKAREEARQTVVDLRARGYSFFLVDGRPADEITAGGGTLIVRKLTAEEVIEPASAEPDAQNPENASDRPRKDRKPKQVVATRPIAGG